MSAIIEQAKALRSQGKTFKEVAVEVGCSEGYLRKRLSGFKRTLDNSADVRLQLEEIQAIVANLLRVV